MLKEKKENVYYSIEIDNKKRDSNVSIRLVLW